VRHDPEDEIVSCDLESVFVLMFVDLVDPDF